MVEIPDNLAGKVTSAYWRDRIAKLEGPDASVPLGLKRFILKLQPKVEIYGVLEKAGLRASETEVENCQGTEGEGERRRVVSFAVIKPLSKISWSTMTKLLEQDAVAGLCSHDEMNKTRKHLGNRGALDSEPEEAGGSKAFHRTDRPSRGAR